MARKVLDLTVPLEKRLENTICYFAIHTAAGFEILSIHAKAPSET
jgi:hypothetical protein